jgi:drug/metabolite transporter (DMT)-like permease
MGMDIRLPIGGLFSILGVMLVVYGFMTQGNEMYVLKSEGYNINIWWGIVMLVFGLIMLAMGVLCKAPEKKGGSCDCPGNPGRGGMGH